VVEKLEMIARVPGVEGVEMVYPHELGDLSEVKSTLGKLGLVVSAVNVNVKSDAEFVKGSLTSPDGAVRAKAVEYLKRGKDAAAELGAELITCCPLSDGYDYPFHVHYASAWERMVEAVGQAAAYRPEIRLHMEYKPFETRVHNLLSSAAKTILLCEAVGGKNLGVTIDIGHSTFGGEPAADSLMQVVAAGLPFYVHTNDNNGKLDWDLVSGACNVWEFAEFMFYLKEFGYDGWVTADVAPFRQDPFEIFALNARFTDQVWKWLDEVDRDVFVEHLHKHDFLAIRKMMEPYVFSLGRK